MDWPFKHIKQPEGAFLLCTTCDEYGAVDGGDRSYGDYMMAVNIRCPDCDGTKARKCAYCETNRADMVDSWTEPCCTVCYRKEREAMKAISADAVYFNKDDD